MDKAIDKIKNYNGFKLSFAGLKITELPKLPKGLTVLNCIHTHITSLNIPKTLKILYCTSTNISSLDLPEGMTTLYCSGTKISSLDLPESIRLVYCSNTPFSEIFPINKNESMESYIKRIHIYNSKNRIVKRSKMVKEEIVMWYWHPKRVEKYLSLYDIDFEEFV